MAAIFPTSIPTALQLLTAQNDSMVVLDANCGPSDTTIFVDDASPLPASGYLTFVDTDEVIFYSGTTATTLTGVTRGADGTTAIAHLAGVDLEQRFNAAYHNITTQEIIGVEQYLSDRFGITTGIVVPAGKTFIVTDGLGIGAGVDSKAVLSLSSTTKGFLPPKMTTTQRDAIASPTEGLVVYNTTTHQHNVYNGSVWKAHTTSGDIVNADVASAAAIARNKLAALTASRVMVTDVSGFDSVSSVTTTTLAFLDATSSIQTQLNAKKAIATGNNYRFCTTGAAGDLQETSVTASRAVVTDANGLPSASAVTATELGYLSGATSAIQTQLNNLATPIALNILINGGLEIWQRGTSFSTTGYHADRWNVALNVGTPTFTITREASTVDTSLYSLKLVISATNGATGFGITQTIENFAGYRGRALSLSCRIYSSNAGLKIRIRDSSGNTLSAAHGGTGWETLTVTRTIGAAASYLDVSLAFPDINVIAGTYYIDSVMFVLGSVAIGYVPQDPQQEFARCQRYFQVVGGAAAEWITSLQAASTTLGTGALRHVVPMRTAPTATVNNPTHFSLTNSAGAGVACTAITISTLTPQGISLGPAVAAGLTAGNATVLLTTNADATIFLDAEL